MGAPVPAISVILITPDRYQSLRKTIGYLRAQALYDQMEIVICHSGSGLS